MMKLPLVSMERVVGLGFFDCLGRRACSFRMVSETVGLLVSKASGSTYYTYNSDKCYRGYSRNFQKWANWPLHLDNWGQHVEIWGQLGTIIKKTLTKYGGVGPSTSENGANCRKSVSNSTLPHSRIPPERYTVCPAGITILHIKLAAILDFSYFFIF